MTIDFWKARWSEGKIGFHEGAPNAFLQRHKGRLGQGRRVLVPLCGKAEDLAYLAAEGHTVVGIEVAKEAVEAFFREHDLVPEIDTSKPIHVYSARGITILCGDFFACGRAEVGAVDALYDRAALVALPADIRPRYVAHLRELLAPSALGLLVSIEYAAGATDGPPYSVVEEEVRRHYAGATVDFLERGPISAGRLKAENIPATEACFALAL